jgi:hypothetical protein
MRLECSDPETSNRPMAADVLLRQEPDEEEEEDEGDGKKMTTKTATATRSERARPRRGLGSCAL